MRALALFLSLLSAPALALGEEPAAGPLSDLRPMARPGVATLAPSVEADLSTDSAPAAVGLAAPRRPMARPVTEVAAPQRPTARPAALETGQGDAVALPEPALAALRPVARPVTPPVSAPAGSGEMRLIALSTSGAMLPPPRLILLEERLGERPADLVHDAVLTLPVTVDGWTRHLPDLRPAMLIAPPDANLIRPRLRPDGFTEVAFAILNPAAPGRPESRPAGLYLDHAERAVQAERVAIIAIVTAQAVPQSLRPLLRPENVSFRPGNEPAPDAPDAAPLSSEPLVSGGQLCGDARLRGEAVGAVPGAGACGIESAVRLTSAGGVRLSSGALMDCNTARALADWVDQAAEPAVGGLGGGIARIDVMGDYACRPRNNQSGNRLSEHSFGRAIDVGGVTLQDGTRITVLNGWGTSSYGAILRQMHRDACGIFGTVLGPEANRFHRDHFHFDTAQYRSGSYCE
jgi:hypothetical protein